MVGIREVIEANGLVSIPKHAGCICTDRRWNSHQDGFLSVSCVAAERIL